MSERNEIFNIKTFAQHGQKTYFFNVKENRTKDVFINVVESLRREDGSFARNHILIFEKDSSFFAVSMWNLQEASRIDYEGEGEVWRDEMISSDKKRKYVFKIIKNKRGLQFAYVLEVKDGEDEYEIEKTDRFVKIEEEDMDNFVIGFDRARAYKNEGRANYNGDASIPLKYQIKPAPKKLVPKIKKI